ncbi:relaxase domain-containing protein [Novosphingobium sp. G106]|nr:relaxase domain-containing protein [Novosphingobium sp. G106]MBV1692473.1 relaxase domain-containing protein [Novosphingobium sp. G106]
MTRSMGAVRSAGGVAKYSPDNYYTAEQAEAASEWSGGGAADLGLAGTVDRTDFEGVLGGKLPGGKQVGEEENRAHGTDLLDVEIRLAACLCFGDKRPLAANMAAVKETMAWAEANLAEARIKKDGKAVLDPHGNLAPCALPARHEPFARSPGAYSRCRRQPGRACLSSSAILTDWGQMERSFAMMAGGPGTR